MTNKKLARFVKRRKPRWTKTNENELSRIARYLNKHDAVEQFASALGDKIAVELRKKWPNNSMAWAKCMASICCGLDRRDPECQKQMIGWFHEHYAGFIVEKHLDELHEAHDKLKSLKYAVRDPIEGAGDMECWLERDGVFIMQDQNVRYAVMFRSEPWYELHVRRLRYEYDWRSKHKYWGYKTIPEMRAADWKPEYGDCRDVGYVLSYGGLLTSARKVDRAVEFWSEMEHFFFRLRQLCVELDDQVSDRYHALQGKGKR